MTDVLLLALIAAVGVALGATIPIVPTGALVSALVALAGHGLWGFTTVVAASAAGAYVGDLATYGLLVRAQRGLTRRRSPWRPRRHTETAVARVRAQLGTHEHRTLLFSRLVPGGRIPVLVAAAAGHYPLRRFAAANVVASLLWAITYGLVGAAGDGLLADPLLSTIAVAAAAMALPVLLRGLRVLRGTARGTARNTDT